MPIETAFSMFRELAKKGIVKLIELPVPHTTVRELLIRVLEFDAINLFSKMPLDEYENKRQTITEELGNLIVFDRHLNSLKERNTPLAALEACARTYDALCFLDRLTEEDEQTNKETIAKQNISISTETAILSDYLATLEARICYINKRTLKEDHESTMESTIGVLIPPHLLAHVESLEEDLITLVARSLVGELSEEQYQSSLQLLLRKNSGKEFDIKNFEKLSEKLEGVRDRHLIEEHNYTQLRNLLEWDTSSLKVTKLEKEAIQAIDIELTTSADQYVPKCGVDNRILDGSFKTIKCASCSSEFCLLPCGGIIIENQSVCPRCRREGFPRLQYHVYLARLDQLHITGKTSNDAYEKLKKEYEAKMS